MIKTLLALAAATLLCAPVFAADAPATASAIQHGKFLLEYGGCSDCHTPGWAEAGGHAPKELLFTGSGMNFQGPWGTTYPINLRLLVQELNVQQWIHQLRTTKPNPPMPWYSFQYLSNRDLADMYAYIHALGPAGKPAHAWVPPGQPAPTPYFKLVLPQTGAAEPDNHSKKL